jgi:hypothetical protein
MRVFAYDTKDMFWHVLFDKPRSCLTTFGTAFSKFRSFRMLYGIALAPKIWQRKILVCLIGLVYLCR